MRMFAMSAAAALCLCAAAYGETLDCGEFPAAGKVTLDCAAPGAWKIRAGKRTERDGTAVLDIAMTAPRETNPPPFKILFDVPQTGIHNVWRPAVDVCYGPRFLSSYGSRSELKSDIARWLSVFSFYGADDSNRLTVACSETRRRTTALFPIKEEGCLFRTSISFFDGDSTPANAYRVSLRFDASGRHFSGAVADAVAWMEKEGRTPPGTAPEAAFEPLYSTWYCFHQNVTDRDIEEECAIASSLGMKTVIVDDGWQTDDNNRGYRFCGDWNVSTNRFPDMRAHVAKIHAMGMKYVLWYSVPFVGHSSSNYARFKGKYLDDSEKSGIAILDPRFPEVREFLAGKYERALKEWDIDGFKLDFIDSFACARDRAAAENWAGRDMKSVPEAVDRLLADVTARLKAVKPDVLVEFRQMYVGPAIRQYGNMLRVADCPCNMQANREGIANLRMTSGGTAVHADMLTWRPEETAEGAARCVLNALFGVVQYSLMLRDIPAAHRSMIGHWVKFSREHRGALLKGAFLPRNPELGYPVLEGEDGTERVVAVYSENAVADVADASKRTFLVNATGRASVSVRLPAAPREVRLFDTYGAPSGAAAAGKGLCDIPVPPSGYAEIFW